MKQHRKVLSPDRGAGKREMKKRRQKALEEEAKAARIKAEDEKYMKEAIKQAKKAAKIGDVPIGCVLVKDGEIIARRL